MMLAAMVALSVVGCGSKTLSNDYVCFLWQHCYLFGSVLKAR